MRPLGGDELHAARAARGRAEHIRAAYEKKYRERKWAEKAREAEDFAQGVLAYREVMELYSGTEVAACCYLRLAGLYGARRDRNRGMELMRESAWRYRGTRYESEAYVSLGLTYLQGLHKPAQAIPYFEKVPFPGGADATGAVPERAYSEAHVKYLSAQQSAAKCEIQLGKPDRAHRRYLAPARRYPQYKQGIVGAYESELRAAEYAAEEIKKRMARFAQDVEATPR